MKIEQSHNELLFVEIKCSDRACDFVKSSHLLARGVPANNKTEH